MGDNDYASTDNKVIDHSNEITFHHSHLYYLSPSDNPGLMLVAKQFNGTCFGSWRRGIIIALFAKKRIRFINGNSPPLAPTSPLLDQWEQVNHMRYGQSNGARIYEVQKDLVSVSHGSSDVSGYFKKVKRFWDEMESLDAESYCICDCNCGGKHKMMKRMENHKLMQFLIGLNEIFNNARRNILMMQSLPGVGKAYLLVIHDEKQIGIHNAPTFQTDSIAFSIS
ncbi:uncharacterized protein LOC107829757 [Nicotiana tabacum]|uniref:Uncharacterized protein LOC107829757 n=1 Tax=Nicotiana tabacum TaxID=4097 RepID=A0A1S4DH83_TOBAC|nr:PREDICTED: uncharacterized protein LOC107829757 [Nicotiana tabacum]